DVRLAAVNAGQLANIAADDSLTAVSALLALQLQIGLAAAAPSIVLADSLEPPDSTAVLSEHPLLPIAAAEASLLSAQRTLALTRRIRFAPSLELGFDTGD